MLVEERLAIPLSQISINSIGYSISIISQKIWVTPKRSSFDDESNEPLTSTQGMANLFSANIGHYSQLLSRVRTKTELIFTWKKRIEVLFHTQNGAKLDIVRPALFS